MRGERDANASEEFSKRSEIFSRGKGKINYVRFAGSIIIPLFHCYFCIFCWCRCSGSALCRADAAQQGRYGIAGPGRGVG